MKRVFAVLLAGLVVIFVGSAVQARAAAHLPTVEIAPCRIQTVVRTVVCGASVVSEGVRGVGPARLCTVDEVYVSVGDEVQAGDALFSATVPAGMPEYGSEAFLTDLLQGLDLSDAAIRNVFAGGLLSGFGGVEGSPVGPGETMVISAPVAGRVSAVNVRRGGLALPGLAAVSVTESGRLAVQALVPEDELYRVAVGQRATVIIRGSNEKLEGVVTAMPESVSSSTWLGGGENVGRVEIALDEESSALPGMSCTVRIAYRNLKDATLVPYEVLRRDEVGEWYLYTTDGGFVYRTYVEYLMDVDEMVAVQTEGGAPFYYLTDTRSEWKDGRSIRWRMAEEQ